MNSLSQHQSMLLGSEEDINALAQKDHATILAVSDSHEAYANLFFILQEYAKQNGHECDALIFCGDGISDITAAVAQAAADSDFAQILPPVIGIVEGNNDADIYPMKNPLRVKNPREPYFVQIRVPLSQTICACGHKIFFTHGHKFALYSGIGALVKAAAEEGADVALYGHTHVAAVQYISPGIFAVNPGSCSRPRAGQPQTYALIELSRQNPYASISFRELRPTGSVPFNPESSSLY